MNPFRPPRQFGRVFASGQTLVRAASIAALSFASQIAVAGPLAVEVRNPQTGEPVRNVRIVAYRTNANGKLNRVAAGKTSQRGRANFNVSGLGGGAQFVIKANWRDRRLSTEPVSRAGLVRFNITDDGSRMRDRQPPHLSINQGQGGVSPDGFSLSGRMWDDTLVNRVVVLVTDPVKGKSRRLAKLYRKRGRWIADIKASEITAGRNINIVVRAVDARGRKFQRKLTRRVGSNDLIRVLRPKANSTVNAEGFGIVGKVRRARQVTSATLELEDSMLGTVIDAAPLRLNRNGRFRFDVAGDLLTPGHTTTATVTVVRTDGSETAEQFDVTVADPGGTDDPDTTAPALKVIAPADGSTVPASGFALTGEVSDDSGSAVVTVSVTRQETDQTTAIAATVDDESGRWSANVPGALLVAGSRLTADIGARDNAGNKASQSLTLNVAELPDTEGPVFANLSPADGSAIPASGFNLSGSVSDGSGIANLEINATTEGGTAVVAGAQPEINDSGRFVLAVRDALPAGETLIVRLVATDNAGNSSTRQIRLQVEDEDDTALEIVVDSPADGSTVGVAGFTLSGRITGAQNLTDASYSISIENSLVIDKAPLTASEDGSFSEDVSLESVNNGDTLSVVLEATDGNANPVSVTLDLQATTQTTLDVAHVLARASWGATPDLLAELSTTGAEDWLEQQLSPQNIDDSLFESFISNLGIGDVDELRTYVLSHMISSRRQLNEVMTQFWENHFNTYVYSSSGDFGNEVRFEKAQNDMFRANALGNFGRLLALTARSPSMLIYLDSVVNRKRDANENFARELLELHTMGVDGGYTEDDIEAAAEIFTGWHLRGDEFFFNADEHNEEAQTFLGTSIDAGWVEQGERLLSLVAEQPATANFICTKLAAVLISDQPAQSVVNRCAQTFLANTAADDQIAQSVRALLYSPEFAASKGAKIKTPIEFMTSAIRGLRATGDGSDLSYLSYLLDMRPFDMPVPTGYSERGDDWMNTNQFVNRVKWAQTLSRRQMEGGRTGYEPSQWLAITNLEDSASIIDAIVRVFLGGTVSAFERERLLRTLDPNGDFDPQSSSAEGLLRKTIGLALSLPGFNFQ